MEATKIELTFITDDLGPGLRGAEAYSVDVPGGKSLLLYFPWGEFMVSAWGRKLEELNLGLSKSIYCRRWRKMDEEAGRIVALLNKREAVPVFLGRP